MVEALPTTSTQTTWGWWCWEVGRVRDGLREVRGRRGQVTGRSGIGQVHVPVQVELRGVQGPSTSAETEVEVETAKPSATASSHLRAAPARWGPASPRPQGPGRDGIAAAGKALHAGPLRPRPKGGVQRVGHRDVAGARRSRRGSAAGARRSRRPAASRGSSQQGRGPRQ